MIDFSQSGIMIACDKQNQINVFNLMMKNNNRCTNTTANENSIKVKD